MPVIGTREYHGSRFAKLGRIHVLLTSKGRLLNFLVPQAARMNSAALECPSEGEIGVLSLVLSRVRNGYDERARKQTDVGGDR
jgi:hypothetical protein